MKRYSINKVSNDLCEFLFVFSYESIKTMIAGIPFSEKLEGSFTDYYNNTDLGEAIFKDLLRGQALAISPYKLIVPNLAELKIVEDKEEDEVTLIYTCPIYNPEFHLRYPSFKDVEFTKFIINEEEFSKSIENVLSINNFFKDVLVEEGNIFDNFIYLNINGKDVNIVEIADPSEIYNSSKSDYVYKLNEQVKLKNKLLKKGNIIYTISKITKRQALEITDDIVKKLNYCNCNTVSEFKDVFRKNKSKVDSFYNRVNCIFEKMLEINNFNFSKETNEYFKSIFGETNYKKYESYIKEEFLNYYVNIEMSKIEDLELYLFEDILKTQYSLDRLKKKIFFKESYEKFKEKYINNMKLYLYVKKR